MSAVPGGGSFSFRCRSMSEDLWHVILVPQRGHVVCSCLGQSWCSHIDATLVAGERAMVPAEEHAEANRAQIAARGRIGPTEGWKADWRNNRRWRGLPPARITALESSRRQGLPMMSIEGRGRGRRETVERSRDAGWMVVDEPVRGCLFHVAPDAASESRAAERARRDGIPIASYEEWATLAAELAPVMKHAIAAHAGDS